jgi:polyribonucleotide nucleotidyltransferase
MQRKFSFPELGLEVEIGKIARQANGAVWVKLGGDVILSTAVAGKSPSEFPGFFPLTVEYRERSSAAGRIPGGYLKREGRLSDAEVLVSRLIDRPIRPLFPKYYFNEVQLISTVYSSDGNFPTSILSVIGSSLALAISDIPFLGPVGAVQIARINGEWTFNAGYEDTSKSDAKIIITGTKNGISMVEGHCNNLSEKEMVNLLLQAHEKIVRQVEWQEEIQKEIGKEKSADASDIVDWKHWENKVKESVTEKDVELLFDVDPKKDRSRAEKDLEKKVFDTLSEDMAQSKVSQKVIGYLLENEIKKHFANILATKKTRLDGRGFEEIRQISSEVGILPCVHGSSLFTRGETQALSSITLGTAQDAQKIDTLWGGTKERSFMLHYNFPPFATGEARPMRAVGRREIGHGYLAESSFINVLPPEQDFPYTIRSVVDITESNGSSSMATVCATTMAMMDTGIPISDMVSGIAMGLVKDSKDNFHILTDILGTEDSYGLMDFKVTGTDKGIMAFQLDIKDKVGLPRELLERALDQAKKARLHILAEMRKVISIPRAEISRLAPRITSFKIPQDKIGAVIGPAGKVIKEIIAKTLTQIDIQDDGTVRIYSQNSESAQEAESWIKTIVGDIETGSVYDGIIKKIAEFGIFVELVPGKEGLVHISAIDRNKQRDLNRMYKPNDRLKVKVVYFDQETGRIRLIAPELEGPN